MKKCIHILDSEISEGSIGFTMIIIFFSVEAFWYS